MTVDPEELAWALQNVEQGVVNEGECNVLAEAVKELQRTVERLRALMTDALDCELVCWIWCKGTCMRCRFDKELAS